VDEKVRPSKVWWKDEDIRKNVYLGTPAVVTILKLLGYDHKFGLGLDLVSVRDLGAAVMFFFIPLAAGATAIWIAVWGVLRRIKNGKNLSHPDALIVGSHPVDAVRRMTGSVPRP
jgi:hypothetical protein